MDEELLDIARRYAEMHALNLGEHLGSGIHGSVCLLTRGETVISALKVHRFEEPYPREREAYLRLRELQVTQIRGLVAPALIRSDDRLLAIEMTVVSPPFLLDFASAHLDFRPEFSDEVWEDWRRKNEEQFGDRWPEVHANSCQSRGTRDLHA